MEHLSNVDALVALLLEELGYRREIGSHVSKVCVKVHHLKLSSTLHLKDIKYLCRIRSSTRHHGHPTWTADSLLNKGFLKHDSAFGHLVNVWSLHGRTSKGGRGDTCIGAQVGSEVVRSDEQDVLPHLVWIGCNHCIKSDLVQEEGGVRGGASNVDVQGCCIRCQVCFQGEVDREPTPNISLADQTTAYLDELFLTTVEAFPGVQLVRHK